MTTIITDGAGNGHKAEVDSFNRLRAFTTQTTQEHHATTINVSFITSVALSGLRTLTLPNAAGGAILLLKNTNPNRFMNIQKILLSSDVSGVVFTLLRNPIIGTLANNTEVIPANLNFGSSNPALAEANAWDEAGTLGITGLTGGLEIDSFIVKDENLILPIDGSITIPNGNALAIIAQNGTGGAAEVSASIRNFFEG